MPKIHSTALVDPTVEMGDDVTIGAYCIIRGHVKIGAGTLIDDHSHVRGYTTIGRGCRIGPAAYVGLDPQDVKYHGQPTHLTIGDETIIRETATLHRSAIVGEERATRIGDRCFIMAGAHVGHNSILGNEVVLANAVLLAGHVTVGDRAFLGGGLGLHQFCRVGRLTIVAGGESLNQDVPPFAAVRHGGLKGYNAVGCRRAGMPLSSIVAIRGVYHRLCAHRIRSTAVAAIRQELAQIPEVGEILEFIASSRRGIVPSISPVRGRRMSGAGEAEE
jgi:UDP-N-acetylglucosamine acyltransferase